MSTSPDRQAQVLKALEQCVVWHPSFARAHQLARKSMSTTKDRQAASSMMLIGDTGVGKSTLCEGIRRELNVDTQHDTGCSRVFIQHCLLVEVPPNATIKTLAIEVLTKLGLTDRSRLEHMGTATLNQLILQRLITTQTQLIILDEFHRILDQGAIATKKMVCRWVNQILNQATIPIVLAGLPTIETLIDTIAELSDRYPYRAHLRYFNFTDEASTAQFHKVIQLIDHNVIEPAGFAQRVILTQEMLFKALCLATDGNFRHLNILLNDTLTLALKGEDNKLTLEEFARAADDLDFCRPRNPFRLSSEDLIAALRKKYA
ncbi:ATPase associated with various cellular activities family protein [Pseudomonas fluorescens]|uniref:ATPase associated with various cellular activities family protein n=1 Tax=Pseudomonas fluorescens TaxID=294 RepID=A0A0P9BEZ4_PSEFL|nr:TniB family NTP-binding protein [Pseudomonas fluorescens]KPU61637.1 ATPase associated with various cellular activities family protein [Pseudomonas fluorescens]